MGLLVAAAVSYHFLEATTGLAPFARVALGASRTNATRRIIPMESPAMQVMKHGTWLGKLMGSFSPAPAVTPGSAGQRSLAYE